MRTPANAAQKMLDRYLSQQNVQHHKANESEWVVSLPGPGGQDIQLQLRLGDYTLFLSSFFMRAPEDNVIEVYRFLLRKNLELRGAKFGLNEVGDVFLTAELPLTAVTEDEIDRYLGYVYAYWEQSYGSVFRIGWAKYLQGGDGQH
jgi:hypothetical protein